MQILKQTWKKLNQTAWLSRFLTCMITMTDLIMFYAAALTLNTLYAGIGNMYVSMIALLAALGAAAGKFLFTFIREGIDIRMEDICYETLDEAVPLHREEDEEILEELFKDAVHFEMRGRQYAISILIRDVLRCVFLLTLEWRSGLLCMAAAVIYDCMFAYFARRSIRNAGDFRFALSCYPFAVSVCIGAGALIVAMHFMKSGRTGLYGVIMMILIIMDFIREHAVQACEILSLRRDLRSLEILEGYAENEEYILNPPQKTEQKAPRSVYVLHGLCSCMALLSAALCAEGILSVTSYPALLSETMIRILIPVSALCAVCFFAYGNRAEADRSVSISARKTVLACISVLVLAITLIINPLPGGVCGSGMLTLQAALPLLMKMRAERNGDEETHAMHTESFHGLVIYLFIIIYIAAGVLLYWNAMASFADIFRIFVLSMGMIMCLDQKPFEKTDKKEESGEEDE